MDIQGLRSNEYLLNKRKQTNTKLNKSLAKLSSGYTVNSAADDAASLAVSEKLRAISMGLDQGVRNIGDGINYSRTVEGCSQEINNMLHRLKELAVQSCNGTYDDEIDRAAMDLEYQQLLEEIGNITDNSDFNGLPLFEKHLESYGLTEGNVVHNKPVVITGFNDTLRIGYTIDDEEKEYIINIPHGKYPVDELADLIDTTLYNDVPNLIIGVNKDHQLTLQSEPGRLKYISGSASSLFYDTTIGSAEGYLLGTTVFKTDTARLTISTGDNDVINFRLGNNDDTMYSIKLDAKNPGYTYSELIDQINSKLKDIGLENEVRAVADYNDDGERVVGLASEKTITGLAGNFIKIDSITSPIYDISYYGKTNNTASVFTGVKTVQNNLKVVRDKNDFFNLDISYYDNDGNTVTKKVKVNLLDDGENTKTYAFPSDIISRINDQLSDAGVPITASLNELGRIVMKSDQFGSSCNIKLDKSNVPSSYMIYDLFDSATLNRLTPKYTESKYTPASLNAQKNLGSNIYITSQNNKLDFKITYKIDDVLSSENISLTIPPDTYNASNPLGNVLNQLLKDKYPSLADKMKITVGTFFSIGADGLKGSDINQIEAITTSSAYKTLIGGANYSDSYALTGTGTSTSYNNYSPNNSSGVPNVSSTAGKTTTSGDTYISETTARQQVKYNYLNYSTVTPTTVKGTTKLIENEGVVDDGNVVTTPAELKLPNVLTQFTADGKSIDNINLTFDLTDKNGTAKNYNISIPKGSTSADAIYQLEQALKGVAAVSFTGGTVTLKSIAEGENVNFSNVGGTLLKSATKSSYANQAGYVSDPASNSVYLPSQLTIPNALSQIPYTCDGLTDNFMFVAGGHSYDLTLTHKTYYSVAELADELNKQIAIKDGGTAATTVKVGSDNKSLIITGPYNESGTVAINSLSTCLIGKTKVTNDPTSDPYYNSATGNVETPATITAGSIASHLPKVVTGTNDNTITMDYSYPDPSNPANTKTDKLTITIPNGTYTTAAALTNAINQSINDDPSLKDKITASYSNGSITFTTSGRGDGYSLKNMGGTSNVHQRKSTNVPTDPNAVVDEGTNTVTTPARITNSNFGTICSIEDLIIDETNDKFSMVINGTTKEFTVRHDTYSGAAGRDDLINQLRTALSGMDVTVTYSGGSLEIRTNSTGTSAKIGFTANNNTAPYFKIAKGTSNPTSVTKTDDRCQIIGQKAITTVEITDYNNKMSFNFSENSAVNVPVNVEVPVGSYTAAELANLIQKSIEDTLPENTLKVSVSNTGVISIKGATASGSRKFDNFQGELFDLAFQAANFSGITSHTEKAGTSSGSTVAYIVGRNTLQPTNSDEFEAGKNVAIYSGLNDNLKFDFTLNGKEYTVDFNIPNGIYTPDELANAIQKAGRTAMKNLDDSLPENIFYATIGLAKLGLGENTTAISSYDKLVMCMKLPNDYTIENDSVIIDGVRGNSSYRVFYSATRTPEPSRIIGKSDLSNGITIETNVNDFLSFDLDGVPVEVTIPAGTYTSKEMADYLSSEYDSQGSLVRVMDFDGRLMFYTTENGAFLFDNFKGNAANDLFYDTTGRDEDDEIGIHKGRKTDNYLWIMKTRVDEHLMRINTTGVSTAERASKALTRLEYANSYLNRWRALSGANENRSNYALNYNQSYIENLNAADSRIRDANYATEMSEFTKQQIVNQMQDKMFAVDKERRSSILNLFG